MDENEEVDISAVAAGGEDGVVGTPPKQGAADGDDGEGDSVEQEGVYPYAPPAGDDQPQWVFTGGVRYAPAPPWLLWLPPPPPPTERAAVAARAPQV